MRLGVCILMLSVMLGGPVAAEKPDLKALYPTEPTLTAQDIISLAYEAAGGETWRRPRSLNMSGYAVFYQGGEAVTYEPYYMFRVYSDKKDAAHEANGKVRIEAFKDEKTVFLIAFDGTTTYDKDGPIKEAGGNERWSESFGFGAIRHALDENWTQQRLPDDMIDGRAAYLVELTDPSDGKTQFGIAKDDFSVLSVAFDTKRGWHERRYSNFFSKPDVNWVQPGRVRLFYNGVKQNEVIWTDFEINKMLDEAIFVIKRGKN